MYTQCYNLRLVDLNFLRPLTDFLWSPLVGILQYPDAYLGPLLFLLNVLDYLHIYQAQPCRGETPGFRMYVCGLS